MAEQIVRVYGYEALKMFQHLSFFGGVLGINPGYVFDIMPAASMIIFGVYFIYSFVMSVLRNLADRSVLNFSLHDHLLDWERLA